MENGIVRLHEENLPAGLAPELAQMETILRTMAETLRAANERITGLEREIKRLTKVTPAQAAAVNSAIRDRAAELCALYRATGKERAAANCLRRAMRLTMGVTSAKEIPRCEWALALDMIKAWDDYKTMRALRGK